MKRKINKKRLALILVAVCLVGLIGIGISYSYYLANISTSNEENKNSDISSATITKVVMDMQGKVTSDGAYPGHKVVKEVVIRGIGEDNSLPANASIQITPDLGNFAGDVTWKLYRSDEAITCSSTVYEDGEQYYEEATCNIPDSASLELEGGSSSSYKNIVVNPNTEIKYYLVVEYANKENQNNQIGKSFNIDIALGDKVLKGIDKIIAQEDTTGKCPSINDDDTVNVTKVEAIDGYLCSAPDAYGTSYYYRGNVLNNYVKFGKWSDNTPIVVRGYYSDTSTSYKEYNSVEACQNAGSYNKNCTEINNAGKDMYWRIIRINGDGTVRVIYDGTSAHANGEGSLDRQIGKSAFNNSYDDNTYVGYMYGTRGSSTYGETHANTNSSTIKIYLDTWYENNIKDTINEKYIVDNIFCNDRSISSDTHGGYSNKGYGTEQTYYRWAYGPWSTSNLMYSSDSNKNMMLKCPQKNDAFTVSNTTYGNGALAYPIGLISIDEIVLAGGWNTSNNGYYLYSGLYWWASSPLGFNGSRAGVCYVIGSGGVSSAFTVDRSDYWVRPILNLSQEVLKLGDGSMNNPYRVE